MADWNNRFFPEDLGPRSTIQNFKPGKRTARAITEIQEKCPNDLEVSLSLNFEDSFIAGSTLYLGGDGLSSIPDGLSSIPDGGEEYEVLQRDSAGEAVWGQVRAI